VDNAHIESSVAIGENTITADRTIVDSLLGREASVTTNEDKQPAGDRLVIGQNSSLEL
jgi:glucose-1-phosphate thymidylyltransferase